AELLHRHLERDAGARRRLFEDHRESAPRKGLPGIAAGPLHLMTHVEDAAQLGGVDAIEIEEVPRLHAFPHSRPTLSSIASAASISALPMMSGGRSRTTFSPAA